MTGLLDSLGPLGVFLLMVPESACIPLPSELTLMSAGFAVHQGLFAFPIAIAAATAGNLAGSLIAYWVGRRGTLASPPRRLAAPLSRCRRLVAARGDRAVFVARLLPLVRSFVSLPAGDAGVPLPRFVLLTVAGCAIWSVSFVSAGVLAGDGWRSLGDRVSAIALVVGLALIAAVLAGASRTGPRRSG